MPGSRSTPVFQLPRLASVLVCLSLAAFHCAAADGPSWPAPAIEPAVDQTVSRLMASPATQSVMQAVKSDHERTLVDLKVLTEIAAPPFKEKARAEAFLARAKALGLDARIDAEGNVIGIRKGTGNGPKLLVSAHLDTVFPEGTDVTVNIRDGKWYAPGISDDTRGLTVLLSWIKVLNDLHIQTVGDLVFAANVGEEELGDLRGMKAIFREHGDLDGMLGLEPDPSGSITTGGVGSHRYEVTFKGPGGHSYVTFGLPSAIHAMGRAVAKIADVRPPANPKTTFTVGTASGGSAVNAIAAEARMAIDIRSSDNSSLQAADREILAAIAEGVAEENARWESTALNYSARLIGDRPGGNTPRDSRIVQAAVRANEAFGRAAPRLVPNSSDANVPMSLGIPAVILSSGGESGGWHSKGEWWNPANAWVDAQVGLATVLALVGVRDVSEPLLSPRR
ncbi:MAG: M20/M25/M40 family metallo-hydrolase [Proteobacteria bacterium]|nr:M20/M25/M40 family metallo-hydrolase [Pseudomonadota bacterium]